MCCRPEWVKVSLCSICSQLAALQSSLLTHLHLESAHCLMNLNITHQIGEYLKNIWRGIIGIHCYNNFQSNISSNITLLSRYFHLSQSDKHFHITHQIEDYLKNIGRGITRIYCYNNFQSNISYYFILLSRYFHLGRTVCVCFRCEWVRRACVKVCFYLWTLVYKQILVLEQSQVYSNHQGETAVFLGTSWKLNMINSDHWILLEKISEIPHI